MVVVICGGCAGCAGCGQLRCHRRKWLCRLLMYIEVAVQAVDAYRGLGRPLYRFIVAAVSRL
eukprot:2932556-Prorocentrum_lima.AAC.1